MPAESGCGQRNERMLTKKGRMTYEIEIRRKRSRSGSGW